MLVLSAMEASARSFSYNMVLPKEEIDESFKIIPLFQLTLHKSDLIKIPDWNDDNDDDDNDEDNPKLTRTK